MTTLKKSVYTLRIKNLQRLKIKLKYEHIKNVLKYESLAKIAIVYNHSKSFKLLWNYIYFCNNLNKNRTYLDRNQILKQSFSVDNYKCINVYTCFLLALFLLEQKKKK